MSAPTNWTLPAGVAVSAATYWTLNDVFAALITDGVKGVVIKGPIGRAGRSFVSTHDTVEEAVEWAESETSVLVNEGYVQQPLVPHVIDKALHRHLVKVPISKLAPRLVIKPSKDFEPFI